MVPNLPGFRIGNDPSDLPPNVAKNLKEISKKDKFPSTVKTKTVGILVICKDEEKNILPLLTTIGWANQIVVNDTGSTDRTVSLLNQFKEHLPQLEVIQTLWQDDFSKARNDALDKITTDWVFWLDADDRFMGKSDKIFEIINKPDQKKFFWLNVKDRNHEFFQGRLFPNLPELRFKGPIHEDIKLTASKAGLEDLHLDIPIRHLGYDDPKVLEKKQARNIRLFEKYPEVWQSDPIRKLQYARGLIKIKRKEEGKKLLTELATSEKYKKSFMRLYAFVDLADLIDPHEALKLWEDLVYKPFPKNIMAVYCGAKLHFKLGRMDEAKDLFTKALICQNVVGPFPINYAFVRNQSIAYLREIYGWKNNNPFEEMFGNLKFKLKN